MNQKNQNRGFQPTVEDWAKKLGIRVSDIIYPAPNDPLMCFAITKDGRRLNMQYESGIDYSDDE